MACAFTFFEKFGDVLDFLDDDDREKFCTAICMYGSLGKEIELPYHLKALFIGFKEDIDNSKKSRKSGAKGGRPRKDDEVSDEPKPDASKDDAEGLNGGDDTVSETEKPGVSETENGGFPKPKTPISKNAKPKPNQANTSQTSTDQAKPEGVSVKRKRFTPPARDEAVAFGGEIGLPESEVDKFLDHFTANGWKVSGKSPMRDWRAAMRNWKRNVPDFSAPPGGSGRVPRSRVKGGGGDGFDYSVYDRTDRVIRV